MYWLRQVFEKNKNKIRRGMLKKVVYKIYLVFWYFRYLFYINKGIFSWKDNFKSDQGF